MKIMVIKSKNIKNIKILKILKIYKKVKSDLALELKQFH